jgi:hypothetical protein
VDAGNSFFSSVAGVLVNASQTLLVQCPEGKAGSYTIPNSVTTIGDQAFNSCINLTNVIIGSSVTTIGDQAFNSCISLANVTIGNGVTSIGNYAFNYCTSLANLTIPEGVTNIGNYAFNFCTLLASVTIPDSITSIEAGTFYACSSLTNVTIGAGVTNISFAAFGFCTSLVDIVIPGSVNNIGAYAFESCFNLERVYFYGNAPGIVGWNIFNGASIPVVYYLPGTTGWDDFALLTGVPTTPWLLPYPTILNFEPNFGVQTNCFGFTISWATNISVVVEACTNLANPDWQPVQTNTLTTGSAYFSDPQWMNYPNRFYRLRSP